MPTLWTGISARQYIPTRAKSVHEKMYHVQGWNLKLFFFENWTHRCMTDWNLTPQFKYSTLRCSRNREIFVIYWPTGAISVHKNDQYVQGWNPTTNFWKIAKIRKINLIFFSKNKKRIKNWSWCMLLIFCKNPIYIRICIYLSQNSWALQRNKNRNLYY